jgi:capsular exopolysaccharide synthesis family protein
MSMSSEDPVPFPSLSRPKKAPQPAPAPAPASQDQGGDNAWATTVDLRRLWALFRRHLRLFAAIVAVVFVAAIVLTLRATPLYTATANVMLDLRKEQVVDTQAVLSGLPADAAVVDTEVEVLKSRQLAERVVEYLKLEQDPEFNGALQKPSGLGAVIAGVKGLLSGASPDGARARLSDVERQKAHERVVDAVISRLNVKRAGLTYVINVGFTSENPSKAARIANTFADRYLLEQLEAKFDATQQANRWLNERLGQLRVQVQQAEAAVEQYKIANNLMSSSQGTLTEQEISSYNQQVAQARAAQAEADARLRTARAQLASGSNGEDVGEALGSQVIQQLRAQRATVSGRVADLEGRYGPRHPEMLKARRELTDIDAQIQAETRRIISNLEAQAQVARQRTGVLAGTLNSAQGALASNNRASVRLRELERNAEAVRTLYESFLGRFKETSTQEGIEQSDARVVSRAKIPTKQSSPKVLLNIALGLVLALGAGLAGVVLSEMLNQGLMTAEDVERRLDMPHLGSVPHLASVTDEKGIIPVDFVVDKPLSSFTEAFRALRTSILYARLGEQAQIVVVTSALPDEGKTTTAVALGRSAAQAGDRVCIVDCDLRRRNVNRVLAVEPTRGLLDVLSGQAKLEDVLLLDQRSGAYVLPLAKSTFTPKDVFGSAAMDRLLQLLRERFDLVIMDTAPTLAVSDTRILAGKVDAVLFLTRWRKTPQKAVEAALKTLTTAGAHVAGVALTQVDMKEQARYGYGDPGYYYAEYKKYYSG